MSDECSNRNEDAPQSSAPRAPDPSDAAEAKRERDRVIADTGWGVKPDDQPANASEANADNARELDYQSIIPVEESTDPIARKDEIVRRVLQAQRRAGNIPSRVAVSSTEVIIYDINGDAFHVKGLGYGVEHLVSVLHNLGAAFDPRQLRQVKPTDPDTREYEVHRAWAWGEERPAG